MNLAQGACTRFGTSYSSINADHYCWAAVTFTGLLSGCAHGAMQIFNSARIPRLFRGPAGLPRHCLKAVGTRSARLSRGALSGAQRLGGCSGWHVVWAARLAHFATCVHPCEGTGALGGGKSREHLARSVAAGLWPSWGRGGGGGCAHCTSRPHMAWAARTAHPHARSPWQLRACRKHNTPASHLVAYTTSSATKRRLITAALSRQACARACRPPPAPASSLTSTCSPSVPAAAACAARASPRPMVRPELRNMNHET